MLTKAARRCRIIYALGLSELWKAPQKRMASKKANKGQRGRVENRKINIPVMVRDVLIASINKGQLLIAIFGLFFIILAIKMPGEKAGELLFELLNLTVRGYLLGYVLFVITVIGWYVQTRKQRRIFTGEISRIADEKKKLQKKILPGLIESSEV
ncbi:MAG: hypothetical protein RQ760_10200 [Sedimentisphaerales bacterium]|nr:hypothetical protein [Sedimentisphaerales bacterium]